VLLERGGRLELSSRTDEVPTIAFDDGRVSDAVWMLRESLQLHGELGDRLDTAVDLSRAARTLAMMGRGVDAARLVGAVSVARDTLGARRGRVDAMTDGTLASLRRQLPASELERALADGEALGLEAALEAALEAIG